MIYASSKDELKKRLVGIATEVQANEKSGFDMKDVVDRVIKVQVGEVILLVKSLQGQAWCLVTLRHLKVGGHLAWTR